MCSHSKRKRPEDEEEERRRKKAKQEGEEPAREGEEEEAAGARPRDDEEHGEAHRSQTSFYCKTCSGEPSLCPVPCFELFHTRLIYKTVLQLESQGEPPQPDSHSLPST